MVIISPILERDEVHCDVIHNTAGKLNCILCSNQATDVALSLNGVRECVRA